MDNVGTAGTVRAIDKGTVHRICSGQVVLTLAVAVKELVENSLDSKADNIEVCLKEYGSESVEVSDNGSGISEENFESVCLKHYTSKLESFEDLLNVYTFGFRGEALSSLCALSKLSISTRVKECDVGWKIDYNSDGKLINRARHCRQVGTTVSLKNLFSTLPVRHKEFLRNLKREFAKMVEVLTGYCLISTSTRITCTNVTASGKRSVVLSTRGASTLKDNFTLVFGIKSWQNMLHLSTVQPSGETLSEFGLSDNPTNQHSPFQLEGFASSCGHGHGRSCGDRQYYFINGRPCDPQRIMKLVNQTYHTYNKHQHPCIVLNIKTRYDEIDINVTPDKRQLMVHHERLLLATIKQSLLALYENIPSSYPAQNTTSSGASHKPSTQRQSKPSLATLTDDWKSCLDAPRINKEAPKRKLDSLTSAAKHKRLDEDYHLPIMRSLIPEAGSLIPEAGILGSVNDVVEEEERQLFRAKITVEFSMDALRRRRERRGATERDTADRKCFGARMNDAGAAEVELSRQLHQHDFTRMEIVGQFNLGFIIARLDQDLFIIDQHAADEKFNFETLQRTTRLRPQKLVCAKSLQLTAVNESLLIDHLHVFQANGFDFIIDSQGDATKRVWLSAVPMSGNWLLGASDVDELLFMLQDSSVPIPEAADGGGSGAMAHYRPSKVRAMFASRACRRAVMVGTALTAPQMKKLVQQLSHLDQPWNCPHGRPTMRHLIGLEMLP